MVSCKSEGHMVFLVGGSTEIPGVTSSIFMWNGSCGFVASNCSGDLRHFHYFIS
jgi:hypothetical protein